MTTCRYNAEQFRMEINGHAGSAPYGEDLVCAACSILGYTLINCAAEVPEYQASFYMDEKRGIIKVECRPDEEHEELCRHMFDVVRTGFEILAAKHPENVRCC